MKEKGKVVALGFADRASRGHMVLPIAAARCPLPAAEGPARGRSAPNQFEFYHFYARINVI